MNTMFALVFASLDNVKSAVTKLGVDDPEPYLPDIYRGRGKRNDLRRKSQPVAMDQKLISEM